MHPFIYFRLDPSWFSTWIRQHFMLHQPNDPMKGEWTHSFYNKAIASLQDHLPGVRYGFLHKYTAALTDNGGQVFVNERASEVTRLFLDMDAKGERVSVSEVCSVVRCIQDYVIQCMDISTHWKKSKTMKQRIATVIVLATKQTRLYEKEKELRKEGSSWGDKEIFKCGFHFIFPFVYVNESQRKEICVQVAQVLNSNEKMRTDKFLEGWSTMIDPKAVNSLRMLGSRRIAKCPKGCTPPSSSSSKASKKRNMPQGVYRRTVNMESDSKVADSDLYVAYNFHEANVNDEETSTKTYVSDSVYDVDRYIQWDASSESHESSNDSSPIGSNASDTTSVGTQKQDVTCKICRGRGECCEERCYVPLCVLNGEGNRDTAFELSMLDLRQAVDWTMIRAPSLFSDPNDGLIKPRQDVDPSVVLDQLYGVFRLMGPKDKDDEQNRWPNAIPSIWDTNVEYLPDSFHFYISCDPLSRDEVLRLYHLVRGPFLDPHQLFGDGDATPFQIPQLYNFHLPSHMVGHGLEGVTFKDHDPYRYPEAGHFAALQQQQQQQQQQGQKQQQGLGKRLGVYSTSYTLDEDLEDYETYRRVEKRLNSSKVGGAKRLETWDPRITLLRYIIQKTHSAYRDIELSYVWNTFLTADGKSVYFCRSKNRFCRIANRSHESNHVYFQVNVFSKGRHESLVEVEQHCYDRPKASKGQQKGCEGKKPVRNILNQIPYKWILTLCPPESVEAKKRERMRYKEHAMTAQQEQPQPETKPSAGIEKNQPNQSDKSMIPGTKAYAKNPPQHAEKFPVPDLYRTLAHVSNSGVQPTYLNEQEQKEKQKKVRDRLMVLWHKFQKHYQSLFQDVNKKRVQQKMVESTHTGKTLYEQSVHVLITWWKYLQELQKGKELKVLHPKNRMEGPDRFLSDIHSHFLTEQFLRDKVQLPKSIRGSFKEYLGLICFWFMTSSSYETIVGSVRRKEDLAQHPSGIYTTAHQAESICIRSPQSKRKRNRSTVKSEQTTAKCSKSCPMSSDVVEVSGSPFSTTTTTNNNITTTSAYTTVSESSSSWTNSSITIRIPKTSTQSTTTTTTTTTTTMSASAAASPPLSADESSRMAFSPFEPLADSQSSQPLGDEGSKVAEHCYSNMTVALRNVKGEY
jgi:hypothetical protein